MHTQRGNFRDLAQWNSRMKPQRLFRSDSLTFLNGPELNQLIRENTIATVIDLRTQEEATQDAYEQFMLEYINYFHIPIDPRQANPQFSADTFNQHELIKDVYRFFVTDCGPQLKEILEIVADNVQQGIVIHCFAGKDRTGFVSAILQMLSGASYQEVKADYLASGMDTREEYLQEMYQTIKSYGGLQQYLVSIGLEQKVLENLRNSLIK